jgi:DNA-binding TFAR19-related protein (PDSD5 family)
VANIAVVKPDKAEKLEMILIQVNLLNFPDHYIECLKRSILRKSFGKVDD